MKIRIEIGSYNCLPIRQFRIKSDGKPLPLNAFAKGIQQYSNGHPSTILPRKTLQNVKGFNQFGQAIVKMEAKEGYFNSQLEFIKPVPAFNKWEYTKVLPRIPQREKSVISSETMDLPDNLCEILDTILALKGLSQGNRLIELLKDCEGKVLKVKAAATIHLLDYSFINEQGAREVPIFHIPYIYIKNSQTTNFEYIDLFTPSPRSIIVNKDLKKMPNISACPNVKAQLNLKEGKSYCITHHKAPVKKVVDEIHSHTYTFAKSWRKSTISEIELFINTQIAAFTL